MKFLPEGRRPRAGRVDRREEAVLALALEEAEVGVGCRSSVLAYKGRSRRDAVSGQRERCIRAKGKTRECDFSNVFKSEMVIVDERERDGDERCTCLGDISSSSFSESY